ncbi:WD40-repeat-containing domain protein [Dipodascopsis tothii]|uniref:WD40-repeat-containing domain protein n=1 Tax=Dipodascopsis tothii TaxID=44089 RepID=UPI0034CFF63C
MANSLKTTLRFDEDVFCVSAHPSQPVIATGLSNGRVYAHRYLSDPAGKDDGSDSDDSDDSDADSDADEDEDAPCSATVQWSTRRHKQSCRTVEFDMDGDYLYTAGLDQVIKKAATESGKVVAKNSRLDEVPTASCSTPNFYLVGTEDSSLIAFDPRTMKETHRVPDLHDDFVSSISALPPTSQGNYYSFITTGSTTLARIDLRRPDKVVSVSDDQEDEILCSCIPPFVPAAGTGATAGLTAVLGMASGVLTYWNKSNWEDQQARALLSAESVDCIAPIDEDRLVAGSADGRVAVVGVRTRRVERELVHGGADGVVAVAADYADRVISAGGPVVKVWARPAAAEAGDEDSDADSDDSDDSDEGDRKRRKNRKRGKAGKKRQRAMKQQLKQTAASFADLD